MRSIGEGEAAHFSPPHQEQVAEFFICENRSVLAMNLLLMPGEMVDRRESRSYLGHIIIVYHSNVEMSRLGFTSRDIIALMSHICTY
jgi:hypothetical protein